ncbi:MAG: hypothetical protein RL013_2236 [Bacteroidota bacterium]|jgi:acetyl esterase/lipase
MKKASFLIFFALFVCKNVHTQQVIPLYEAGKVPNATAGNIQEVTHTFPFNGEQVRFVVNVITPELTAYLPEASKNTGFAVIICPGGGYAGLAIDHEGHHMAKKLSENGIAGFVLKNRLPNAAMMTNKEIVPLQDAQRAIQLVRENAGKWGVNPGKIGIAGSSAGGHLASSAGTHYRNALIDNARHTSLRPDFMILNYPVISFADSLTHHGSRFNLIGNMEQAEFDKLMADKEHADKNLAAIPVPADKVAEYSSELQVTDDTPPVFITHAVDDEVVKVQNSLLFEAALRQHGVPVETFFYARGGHGYGMFNPFGEVAWIDNCIRWILHH